MSCSAQALKMDLWYLRGRIYIFQGNIRKVDKLYVIVYRLPPHVDHFYMLAFVIEFGICTIKKKRIFTIC